ncbi:DUF928 domain-containing protein [Laspinema sp. D1]|uniref:DUF928 domain-containing protein n=1 Tax=Laspinema palackyanum TaxID=3231601 RepID=UPI00347DA5BF|nr:DUF928 domain-containing protein [Laspinema sp. D2b]
MSLSKFLLPRVKIVLALVWLIFDITIWSLPMQGESNPLFGSLKNIDPLIFNEAEWEKDDGPPGRREDPGRRGGDENICERPSANGASNEIEELPLIVIAPPSVRGLTVEERPTLWFYIPFEFTEKLSAEFSLSLWEDKKEGRRIHEQMISLTGTPGIVSVSLPPTVEPLEEGKEYRFVFTIVCNPNSRVEDVFVNGFVRRTTLDPSLQSQLAAATPLERTALYAQAGIWHETLTSLADYLRRTNDPSAASLLTALLESVGLSDISRKSVIDCCTPPN